MAPSPASPDALREKAAYYLQVPFHALLKPELVSLDGSGVVFTFRTQARHLTPATNLHAGGIYIALELANVLASLPHMASEGAGGLKAGEIQTSMTVDTSCSLLSTVYGENQEVKVTAKMLRRSKRLAFFEASAFDAAGTLLARSKTTKVIATIRPKAKL